MMKYVEKELVVGLFLVTTSVILVVLPSIVAGILATSIASWFGLSSEGGIRVGIGVGVLSFVGTLSIISIITRWIDRVVDFFAEIFNN